MKALHELRRFILAKDTDEERHEIRGYVVDEIDDIAVALDTPPDAIRRGLAKVEDDTELARRLLGTIKTSLQGTSISRRHSMHDALQARIGAIASTVQWCGDQAHVDITALLKLYAPSKQTLLTFICEQFEVHVRWEHLAKLARLKKSGLAAFVDSTGLHVRWSTGGLNLAARALNSHPRAIFPLPDRTGVAT